MLFALLLATAVAGTSPEPEVEATLSGYDLLWPTSNCCAFDMKIFPDGRVAASIYVNNGKRPVTRQVERQLSAAEMVRLRADIEKAQLQTLPAEVGDTPIHGAEKKITVRSATGLRRIAIGTDAGPKTNKEDWLRARALWSAIRNIITIPEATFE